MDGNYRCASTLAAKEVKRLTSSSYQKRSGLLPAVVLQQPPSQETVLGGLIARYPLQHVVVGRVVGVSYMATAPALTTKFAVDLRTKRKTNQKATSRALASINKRHKTDGEGEVHNTGWLLSEPIRIPGPVDPQRGYCVVAPADTRHLLTFGTLLNDNIVQGYLNLLASKFDRLGIPVRIVMPQFYPAFLRQGWAGVQRWVKETAFMESNWLTAQIILVPIFTGPI